MSNDEFDEREPRLESQEAEKPTRDARGRWAPGYCPNPAGRPRKKYGPFESSDLQQFGNTLIDVRANGQNETMLRRAALLNKMFESAMKGSVTAQRFLYKEFERSDMRLAEAVVRYDRLIFDQIINNSNRGKPRALDMPLEDEAEIVSLGSALHHYYPNQYPSYAPVRKPPDRSNGEDEAG